MIRQLQSQVNNSQLGRLTGAQRPVRRPFGPTGNSRKASGLRQGDDWLPVFQRDYSSTRLAFRGGLQL
jgi:hypothetical protein